MPEEEEFKDKDILEVQAHTVLASVGLRIQ
jgi:hypothetical protein